MCDCACTCACVCGERLVGESESQVVCQCLSDNLTRESVTVMDREVMRKRCTHSKQLNTKHHSHHTHHTTHIIAPTIHNNNAPACVFPKIDQLLHLNIISSILCFTHSLVGRLGHGRRKRRQLVRRPCRHLKRLQRLLLDGDAAASGLA